MMKIFNREKPFPPQVLTPTQTHEPAFTMEGGVQLGVETWWNPEQLPNAHIVAIGASGSGKTQTLKGLALALARTYESTQLFVIDFHGDQDIAGEKAFAFHQASPHGINPLIVNQDPEGGGPNLQAIAVLLMLKKSLQLGGTQVGLLLEVLKECYAARGIVADDLSTWTREPPSFRDLENILNERAEDDGEMRRLLIKLATSFQYGIFSRPQPSFTEHMIRIDLSKLPPSLQTIAAESLARWLMNTHRLQGEMSGRLPRTFLFIDEAKEMNRDEGAACDRIIADGRKYGLALVLASQSERHLSLDVIGNSSTKIVLPVDQTEVRKVSNKFRFPEMQVARLKPLQALCRFGATPAKVEIFPYYKRL